MGSSRGRRPLAWLRAALGVLALSWLVSCGGAARKPSVAPTVTDGAWMPVMIGGSSDISVSVRPAAVRSDPYWGPLMARMLSKPDRRGDPIAHGVGVQLSSARQIDFYVTLRDPIRARSKSDIDARSIGWMGVVYGLPPTDPMSFRKGNGTPLFQPGFRLPSGAIMYPGDPRFIEDSRGLAPSLFWTPDGTWIVTDQISAPHVRDQLARNPASPPPLSSAADSLAGVTFNVTSLRFVNAGRTDESSMTAGAVSAGLGLRGGANGALEGYADYATEADAQRAYKAFQRSCAEKSDKCVFEPGYLRDARAEQDDRRILVTMVFSEALLRSIQNLDD